MTPATPSATIILHLPAYRARALKLASEPRESESAYDANVAGYLNFLIDGAAEAGYTLTTDQADPSSANQSAYSIDAPDHAAKKAAHDWLDTQPDIWNWMP